MKKNFSDEALAIWSQIIGKKGFVTSNRIGGFADILNRELKLAPVMIRFNDQYELCDLPKLLTWRNRDFPDEWCSVYYTPADCEVATGSRAANWTQWAAKLLKYGRKPHKFAPKMRPPTDVLDVMEAKGQLGGVQKTPRFLSLETVLFYLAVQTRTWSRGREHHVLEAKRYIEKNGVTTLSFLPTQQEPVDVDQFFPSDGPPAVLPKTRQPKAGQGLVAYNPMAATRQPKNAPISSPASDLRDLTLMGESELEALQARVQAALEAKRLAGLQARNAEEAAKAIIVHGDSEVWPDRAEYATMTVRYADGTEVAYYHRQFMEDRQRPTDSDLDLEDLLDG